MFLLKYFKGFLVIQCTHSVLTIMLTSTVQCIILAVNIWVVKCDKVVDFPKSIHIFSNWFENILMFSDSITEGGNLF